jgi:tetratricopeptide (TPR) repeat protein
MVIASPQDQDNLKLLQEVRHIQDLLRGEDGDGLPIQIDVLEQPDRSQLARKLEQGNYQVLHYAGHSDFGSSGGDLSLVNRQTGLTERLSGDDLAGLLVNNHVALTVFNSCRSGHTAVDDADIDWRQQNLVQALINRGVPSIVAMAERIPDEVAIAFTQLFYPNLRKGFPIDLSLSRTRQGLSSAFGSDQHYWALPILHLQPDFDGYLYKHGPDADSALDPEGLDVQETLPTKIVPAKTAPATITPPAALSAEEHPAEEHPAEEHPARTLPQDEPVEVPAVAGATAVLLTQLENTELVEQDEDEALASYVEQLSKISRTGDEPLMRADEAEVLVSDESQRAGMEIYDVLPEVSPDSGAVAAPESVPNPVSSESTQAQTAIPQGIFKQPNQHPSERRRPPESSSLVWFALGLVGVVGVIGLSVLAVRWSNQGVPSVSTSDSLSEELPEPASPDPSTLIRRAEEAIAQGRYDDARADFERALTQELVGRAAAGTVSDSIWTWVSDTQEPELLYVKGRIAWQEIARLGSDIPSYETRYEQRVFASQALEAWERTDDRFLEGRIAQGFAEYATEDLDAAIANWEAAIALYDSERQQPVDSDSSADPIVLHAYAGLVMAHSKLAGLNPDAIVDDDRISEASADEKAILAAESEKEASLAREYFLRLEELDPYGKVTPGELSAVTDSPDTWHNWLWTEALLDDWRRDYRYWDSETSDADVPE